MIKVTVYNYLDKTYKDEFFTEEHFLKRWYSPSWYSPNCKISWILRSAAIGIEGKILVLAYNKFRHLTNL